MVTRVTSGAALAASDLSDCLERLRGRGRQQRPLATYRLQLYNGFGFADAERLVPYLRALGVSHCYLSPILRALGGSMHGYDIVDHSQFNPEIGTEEQFFSLVDALKRHGMGVILDTVPNHMGVGHGDNPWWQDVLENGRASEHADFFDIDWEPEKPELLGKVLIPILGDQYGKELEQGHIRLSYEPGRFFITYYDRRLPIDAQTFPLAFEVLGDLRVVGQALAVLDDERGALENILWDLRQLPPHHTTDADLARKRQRALPELKVLLAELSERSAGVRALIERAVAACNGEPGNPRTFDALHRLLEAQAYRLAHWRVSAHEINYRRFFDINDLVGLRVENPRVFTETHRLLRRLLADGGVEGLRIDHPDGLLNPVQYFTRVQMLYAASQCCGGEPQGTLADNGIELEVQEAFGHGESNDTNAALYLIVEKILEHGEELPADWPVDGTSGYDFANLVNGILIDGRNERAFTNLYRRFLGWHTDVDTLAYEAKKLIMRSALSSEVTVLSHRLDEVSSMDRCARDFTRNLLSEAIRETIACFPVYRTYIDERGHVSERDRNYINQAIRRAKRRNPSTAASLYDFLGDILLLKPATEEESSPEMHRARLAFALKFQQLTGPVMAKALEDTVCYVYNRFVSVNEVGGSPADFGRSVEEFHEGNLERAARWPYSMLGTSTHDTKRSEDVRARLDVLSEMPKQWGARVARWRRNTRWKKRVITDGRTVPDANEEYLLYQTLVGTWPFHLNTHDHPSTRGVLGTPEERDAFTRRIQQYMKKAVHEAKVNLSWINPDPEYTQALEAFIQRILTPGIRSRPNVFLREMENFAETIAYFGVMNSLAMVLLKLTAPGVPDIYQGQEVWDFSLVDPDNRRPVDFQAREKLLAKLLEATNPPDPSTPAATAPTAGAEETVAASAQDDNLYERGSDDANGASLASLCSEMLPNYHDGRLKLWTTMRALDFRREHPALFQLGTYTPVQCAVEHEPHAVAFLREHEGESALTAVPRFAWTLMAGQRRPPLAEAWGGAALQLPRAGMEFVNVLTGELLHAEGDRLLCREVFARFPVALLWSR